MAFFDALRRMLRAEDAERDRDLQARLAEAWGLSDTSHPEFPRQVPA
ncbi:MAG: hypothetical protein IRY99_25345, partial [Isosphaeraceae bacterium]|nr:hypothetical protein [Isosphaeraceae bacterium]